MISLPTLPTDSLYKFLFVFGIVLIVTSLYFINQNIQADKKELLLSENLLNHYKLKTQSIKHYLDSMDKSDNDLLPIKNRFLKQSDSLKEQFNNHKIHSRKEVKGIILLRNQLLIEGKDLLKLYNQRKIKSNQLEDKWNKIKDTIDYDLNVSGSKEKVNQIEKNFYSNFLIIVFSIGLILTSFGGILWYIKSQYHIDRILAMQAYQMEIELNNKSKMIGRIHFEPRNLPRKQIRNKHK